MINQAKIQDFLDKVYHSAEQQAFDQLNEINRKKEETLQKIKKEAEIEAEQLYLKEMEKTELAISAEASRKERELQEDLFQKRESIRNEIFDEAKKRILAFTETEAYLPYLRESARKAAEIIQEPKRISLRPADLKFAAEIQTIFGTECEIQEESRICYGGFSAENETMFLDATIDRALEQEAEAFTRTSGLKVVQE